VRRGALLWRTTVRRCVTVRCCHALDAPVAGWTTAADELIGAGVTRIERDKVATVLAELADGTAPSTVARKVGVGYATVARIAEKTKRLQRADPAIISTNGSGKVTP
jgi:hypothetical protein